MVALRRGKSDYMKPYVLVAADFLKTGGMDRANYALAEFLADRGAETHLVAYRVADELLAHERIVFHRVPKPLNSYFAAEPLLDRFGRKYAARIAAEGGTVVVNGGNCAWNDVNWIHYVHAAYEPGAFHAGQGPQPGLIRLKSLIHRRVSRARERRIVPMARVVIANSKRTARDLTELVGVPSSSVRCVYYGIDNQLFRPATPQDRARARFELGWPIERPVALFVGALGDRRKGFDTLFNAWRRLCALPSWDTDLVVVGTGSEVEAWRKRAAECGMGSRVSFLGKRQDVPVLLAASDVMVAPTRYEAYGLAVHEALCCGLPSFVTRDAGVAEQYPPGLQELLLNDPNDDADLAERLKAWRRHPFALRSELAGLAARLSRRTWNDMAQEFIALTEECR
jgi:glycosyltransferase involved in cell wall biosynthesis